MQNLLLKELPFLIEKIEKTLGNNNHEFQDGTRFSDLVCAK
jgi:hypothetical protein